MKVERKKAREELDVVSVIEWRATVDDECDDDRWFLLIRRPEGGESLISFIRHIPPFPFPSFFEG